MITAVFDQVALSMTWNLAVLDVWRPDVSALHVVDLHLVLETAFRKFDPGARGIVFGDRGINRTGHVFNIVVDQKREVKFWDWQSMMQPAVEGNRYKSFLWIRSN